MKIALDRLDETRPFGTCHGEGLPNGLTYMQSALGIESWPYDQNKELILENLTPKQKEAYEERVAKAKSKRAAAPQEQKRAETTLTHTDDDDDGIVAPPKDDDDEVNLVSWLRGEEQYLAAKVTKAIKARYGTNKPKMADAAVYLVEDKNLLPWADVTEALRPADWRTRK